MTQSQLELNSESQSTSKLEAAFFCWLLLHPKWMTETRILDVWLLRSWIAPTRTIRQGKPVIKDESILVDYYNQYKFKSLHEIRGLTTLITESIAYEKDEVQQGIYKWILDSVISHTQDC